MTRKKTEGARHMVPRFQVIVPSFFELFSPSNGFVGQRPCAHSSSALLQLAALRAAASYLHAPNKIRITSTMARPPCVCRRRRRLQKFACILITLPLSR